MLFIGTGDVIGWDRPLHKAGHARPSIGEQASTDSIAAIE
jgi:hypothetical protein